MVWDVLEDDVDILGVEPTFDMVLDKGCLDTFLFRSERKLHEALVQRLLGRVYSLTRRYYVVVTPRSKIKPLRDYEGFSVQERRVLRDDLGALQSSDSKKEEAYLFICVKNFRYIPEQEPITEDDKELSGTCDQCGISYVDFCKSSPSGKESRRWRNHRLHCKGDNCVNVMS
jgi:predicted phosphohydrolase